jgi:thiamine biosynthesis lipoprotein ApbE
VIDSTEAPSRTATWEAFGTTVVLRLTEPTALAQAERLVRAELEALDEACSRFRADSELTAVNARAGLRTVIGPLLEEALELSLRAAEITDGALDPTVGLDLERAGYDRDWSLVAERGSDEQSTSLPAAGAGVVVSARRVGRWEKIELDRALGAVTIPHRIGLDLGATAKAWAADRAARAAMKSCGCGALVSIGGDLAFAGSAPQEGWLVRVTDDHRASLDAPGQTIRVSSGGLATSSTTTRRWRKDGVEMHHIIDPLTGTPADSPWRTVSVAAESCAEANIAATATLAKSDAGTQWLGETGLPARLVGHDGSVLTLGDWPAPSEESP